MYNKFLFWWRYLRRQTPWDTGIVPPEIVALVGKLPLGRVLDLGCGTGTTSIYLAQRGWQVTGIDFVAAAIQMAQRKAAAARVTVQFYAADATRLDFLNGPFDLLIDVGCLHSLSPIQQQAYAEHAARLARSGAPFALYAFAPRLLAGRRAGLSRQELVERFAAFELESMVTGQDKGSGPESSWYLLRRR